jgi:hypothetical protein
MAKLLKKENNSEHADRAAKIIQDALGIALATEARKPRSENRAILVGTKS